ncbi:unnamed protein product [Nesidiocoris tenuis]|uniref:RNA-directed DNA polymerase n=1 Tax=Nesidiocoris tenuis TaxID=355587 RepID=A0A6H5H9A8_9HEMI|nr:unnamed protein product [Nesidiocoris tenuis]
MKFLDRSATRGTLWRQEELRGRTCCCPGHSTRKPRSYRLEARTLHLDPGLLPLEGLRTTLDIVKKKNQNVQVVQVPTLELKSCPQIEDLPTKDVLFSQNSTCDRIRRIEGLSHLDSLTPIEREEILRVIHDFNDLYYLPGDKLSTIPGITHRIATQTEEPIYLRPYRIPHVFKEDVENQLLDMEKQGIIRRSNSAYNFPLIVVRKKPDQNSGKIDIRICIDYRKLNEITIGQTFPIPNIADILDSLGNSRYFTTIDLASAFHQISVDPRDIQKTAFSSGNAHWEYLKMPFGLKSAPATMAKAMSMVLNSHKGIRAFAYLDDVIVHSPDLKRHIEEIRLLFQAMRKFHLRISPQKCAYLRKEVTYLGHHISDKGVLPDESKVAVLKRMPVPRNVKEVKSFVAFASYYRKFVKNFAQIAVPLTRLTKKDVPFRWTSQEQQEATVVQRKLTTIAAEQLVDECASRLMYLINKYRADVESLTDSVLFAKMGFLHPHILTPHQLVDALSEAKNHLRNGTRFPVPINLDQAHNVLKTLRITAYFSEGKLGEDDALFMKGETPGIKTTEGGPKSFIETAAFWRKKWISFFMHVPHYQLWLRASYVLLVHQL